LGTPFLSAVEPHGSAQTPGGNPGYFITMPKIKNHPPVKKILAFISESHSHIAYCSKNPKTMVVINAWDDLNNVPVTEEIDDNLDWETYTENWAPHWELRGSEGIEFGLPGFSVNTSIHVIPPQHLIGKMHQAPTIAARQKLVEMGDISRIRSANRNWFCQHSQQWSQTYAYSYFEIHRMRTLQSWPQSDPYEKLFQINYFQYKAMWDHVCLWTDRYRYYYCMVKFSEQFRTNTTPEPDWFDTWWKRFGLNPSAIHPDVIDTAQMFLFHQRNFPNTVHKLKQITDAEYRMLFTREKHPWVIRAKYVLQQDEDRDEDPKMYREIYTQHWDPYQFNHFHDQPVE
jgi:hypothetical protein